METGLDQEASLEVNSKVHAYQHSQGGQCSDELGDQVVALVGRKMSAKEFAVPRNEVVGGEILEETQTEFLSGDLEKTLGGNRRSY